jgi:hypothetical protein
MTKKITIYAISPAERNSAGSAVNLAIHKLTETPAIIDTMIFMTANMTNFIISLKMRCLHLKKPIFFSKYHSLK